MIHRASVQLWGIVRQSAGPPKSAGRKKGRRSCGTDPILSTQRVPRGRDPILSTQRIPSKIFRAARANLLTISRGATLYKIGVFIR